MKSIADIDVPVVKLLEAAPYLYLAVVRVVEELERHAAYDSEYWERCDLDPKTVARLKKALSIAQALSESDR